MLSYSNWKKWLAGGLVLAGLSALAGIAQAAPPALPEGGLDPSFGGDGIVVTNLPPTLQDVAIDADGRIVGVGWVTQDHPRPYDFDLVLLRYEADGDLDPTFGGDGIVFVDIGTILGSSYSDDLGVTLEIDSAGRILVAGQTFDGTAARVALLRFLPDGSLDTAFHTDGIADLTYGDVAFDLTIDADGKILATGALDTGKAGVIRYNSDGSLDTAFGSSGIVLTPLPGGSGGGLAIALDLADRIVIQAASGPSSDIYLLRYLSTGVLDTSFDGDGIVATPLDAGLAALAIDVDGKSVMGGYQNIAGKNQVRLARYNSDGSLDTTFGSSGLSLPLGPAERATMAFDLILDPAERILVAAGPALPHQSTTYARDFTLLRYTPDGVLDTTFGTGGVTYTPIQTGAIDYGFAIALKPHPTEPDTDLIVLAGSSAGQPALAQYFNTITPVDRSLVITSTGGAPISALTVQEGATAQYRLHLSYKPLGTVLLSADPPPSLDLGSGPGIPITLTFTRTGPQAWDIPQSVSVSAVDDTVHTSGDVQILHTATGGAYDGFLLPAVTVSVSDNDLVLETPASVSEEALDIVLDRFPPRLRLEGELPSACATLLISQSRVANTITVTLTAVETQERVCSPRVRPFKRTLELDGSFDPGTYTVFVNGLELTFTLTQPLPEGQVGDPPIPPQAP